MQARAIGIDLGCTNIKGVLIERDGTILKELKADTNEQDSRHWKSAVSQMVNELIKDSGRAVHAIGLSAPGLADGENKCISIMPGH